MENWAIYSARKIPMDQLQGRITELTPFKDRDLVLVCRTQMRSANAATTLKNAGFHKLMVLRGGMMEWNRRQLPLEGRGRAL